MIFRMKNLVVLLIACVFFSNCARILVPRKQKITITTNSDSSSIYLNNEEFGTGKSVSGKIRRDGPVQIIVKTPGSKDTYDALVATKRPTSYWLIFPLNCVFVTAAPIGMLVDAISYSKMAYNKNHFAEISEKSLTNKQIDEKYIEISNIGVSIRKTENSIKEFELKHSDQLYVKIKEILKKDSIRYESALISKKKKKNKSVSDTISTLSYDNTKFTKGIESILKNSGYVDTINRVFLDNNNTLVIGASIKKLFVFNVYGRTNSYYNHNYYHKALLHITWYIKNSYDQVLDSVETQEFSGNFSYAYKNKNKYVTNGQVYDNIYQKMYGDAIDISFLKLRKNAKFIKYLKLENSFDLNETSLSLNKPNTVVSDKSDASIASVIVKTKDGHGSGFAITNDGYIVTNYHVVAGKNIRKMNLITVITSGGKELEGTVVRVNKFRDLALIKVNHTFEKAFEVSNVKSFKVLQDVYTTGAPKSIELGQSVSIGVISNERKNNNNHLLQLSMSINGGNSGGPLYDASGKLHGVIVSKLVGLNTEGVSFAVPAHMIKEYLKLKFD
jgi:S1-C subfamily serine protease